MTPEQAEALGRRWIAAGGGWREGMLGSLCDGGPKFRVTDLNDNGDALHEHSWWPDLRDAATRGAALEVVRERWGAPFASLVNERGENPSKWAMIFLGGRVVSGASEAECIVAALEAAPRAI